MEEIPETLELSRPASFKFMHENKEIQQGLPSITQSFISQANLSDFGLDSNGPRRQTIDLPSELKRRGLLGWWSVQKRELCATMRGLVLEVSTIACASVVVVKFLLVWDPLPLSDAISAHAKWIFITGLLYAVNMFNTICGPTFAVLNSARKDEDNTKDLIEGLGDAAPLVGFSGQASHITRVTIPHTGKHERRKKVTWDGLRYWNYGSWVDASTSIMDSDLRSFVVVYAKVDIRMADEESQDALDKFEQEFREFLQTKDVDVTLNRVNAVHHTKWRIEKNETVMTRSDDVPGFPTWMSVWVYLLASVLLLGIVYRIYFWLRVDIVDCRIFKVVSKYVLGESKKADLTREITREMSRELNLDDVDSKDLAVIARRVMLQQRIATALAAPLREEPA